MKKAGLVVATGIAAIAVVAITVVTLRFVFARLDRIPGATRRADAPEVARADSVPPASKGPPLEILCRRSRDELLVFARRREFGRPAADIEVQLAIDDGSVFRIHRTDEFGVLRARAESWFTSTVCRVGEASVEVALPPSGPPESPPSLQVLANRTVVRPGDHLRFCIRAADAPESVLRFDPPTPGAEEIAISREIDGSGGFMQRQVRWIPLGAIIPDDVRPGVAVAHLGGTRLEIPVLPRFGPAVEAATSHAPGPSAPDAPDRRPGELRLEYRDGAWSVESREEIVTALFYATAGDRFLTHAAVSGEGRRASAVLSLEEGRDSEVRVHAVVSTLHGFDEASAPGRGSAGSETRLEIKPATLPTREDTEDAIGAEVEADGRVLPSSLALAVEDLSGAAPNARLVFEESAERVAAPLESGYGGDRLVRALALPKRGGPPLRATATVVGAAPVVEPTGPERILEGDVVAGAAKPPPARPFLFEIRRRLRAGETATLDEPGVAIPPESEVVWVLAPTKLPIPVRIRSGDSILLDTSTDGSEKRGRLRADQVVGAPVRLEAADAGLDGPTLWLFASAPCRPETVRASEPEPSLPFRLSLDVPSKASAGSVVECRVGIAGNAPLESPVRVQLLLPSGALPAEDGWSIRERAPSGTRITLDRHHIEWRLPRVVPGTTLSARIRFPWKGRFGAPPVHVECTQEPFTSLHSAGAVVVVE